jgi:hypothetical protein
MSLQKYVADKNRFHAMFNTPAVDLNYGPDRQKVAYWLDSDLSPENLTCDGERPRAQVASRYKMLTKAAKELKALDPSVTFCEFT